MDKSEITSCLASAATIALDERVWILRVMPQQDDWRLDRRELIEGHTLTWERWRAPKPTWDHDHCVLCWAKIADWPDGDVQHEAYVDEEHSEWLCAACAKEFRDFLSLKIVGGPAVASPANAVDGPVSRRTFVFGIVFLGASRWPPQIVIRYAAAATRMGKRFTITFPPDRPYDFYTRVFWFGEALHSPIVHDGLGTLCDVDKAREVIWFDLADSHDIGMVKKVVRQQLARFQLTADAVVSIT